MAADTTTSRHPDARFLLSHPAHFIALGFGSGLAPFAPGTFGTLVGLALFLLLEQVVAPWHVAVLAVPLFFVGVWASNVTSRDLGVQDHGAIVIDEIVAFLPVAVFANKSVLMLAVAFGLFRLFDIWKPFPIRQVERRVKGGFGVMIDDVLAAIYACIAIALLVGASHKYLEGVR
ncbi:MAG TPA: phosphatidylglycerophosphatase A [Usitatibacter sp.]|nr:phosphatidylglycerophosphatase A [Usitatibacter sp.]